MAKPYSYLIPKLKQVEQNGITVDRYEPAFPKDICGHERVLPNCYLLLTHQGATRVLYDMQETTLTPNMIVLVMPGHLIRFIDRTDDYVFSRLVVAPDMLPQMQYMALSHDIGKYHSNPAYVLTDEQVGRLMKILELLEVIAGNNESEVPFRRQMILTQMAIGYEFLNYYRSEQDKKQKGSSKTELLKRFCDLLAEHFQESREVKFYAEKLNLHPYYFTRAIKEAYGGILPAQWIEQYIITLAKKAIETQSDQSLKKSAILLGFTDPSSFYRYFKHATGMTAKEYREACRQQASYNH